MRLYSVKFSPVRTFSLLLIIVSIETSPQTMPPPLVVIYNTNSQISKEIAEYYSAKRNILENRLIGIPCTTEEVINKDYYNAEIRDVLRSELEMRGLKDSIKYIVTTKGLPLKIIVNPNKCWTIQSGGGSLESFLCLLYDDIAPYCATNAKNHYFRKDEQFRSFTFTYTTTCPDTIDGIISYLVTRLDAYTKEEVFGMIDRSVDSDKSGLGYYLLDGDPHRPYDDMDTAAINLSQLGLADRVIYETTQQNIFNLSADSMLIGYCGHGRHASSDPPANPFMGWTPETGYLGGASFSWLNGAAFITYESFNGYSFLYENNECSGVLLGHVDNQNLVADFIRDGGTVGFGHVYEPYIGNVAHEAIFFERYARGYNFIEAAYMSLPVLYFHNVVVGDPLCIINPELSGKPDSAEEEVSFKLHQNFPNPFNDYTIIRYELSKPSIITLYLFNALGEKIILLDAGLKDAGIHSVNFKPLRLSAGVYFFQIIVEGKPSAGKMIYLP